MSRGNSLSDELDLSSVLGRCMVNPHRELYRKLTGSTAILLVNKDSTGVFQHRRKSLQAVCPHTLQEAKTRIQQVVFLNASRRNDGNNKKINLPAHITILRRITK